MAAFVIDASIAAWRFPDEHTWYTNAILQSLAAPTEAVAPRLWAYERRNYLLVGMRRQRITKGAAGQFLDSGRAGTPSDCETRHLVDPCRY